MSILFAGSRPAFLTGTANTTLNGRDADFTPVGTKFTGNFRATGQGFTLNTPAPSASYWFHILFMTPSQSAGGFFNSGRVAEWFDNLGDSVCALDLTNNNLALDGPGGTPSSPMSPLTVATEYTLDLHATKDVSNNWTVTAYINGVSAASISFTSTKNLPSQVIMDFYDSVDNSNTDIVWYCSECIITDNENTIGWRLASLVATAAGNYDQWFGGYPGVSDLLDGKSISSDTDNQRQSWSITGYVGPTVSVTVRGLIHSVKGASDNTTGPNRVNSFARISGTDYDDGTLIEPGPDTTIIDLANNPATAAAWTTGELAAGVEVGVKSSTV